MTPNDYKPCFQNKNTVPCSCDTQWISKPFASHISSTTRNPVIYNHHVCNWDATAGRMQLSLVFYATTMDFGPLFECVYNSRTTMNTFKFCDQPVDRITNEHRNGFLELFLIKKQFRQPLQPSGEYNKITMK